MPYKHTSTHCIVRLVALRRLAPAVLAQCQALRQEAGRLWTDVVTLHAQARAQGQWLSASDLEQTTKGGQALCQKVAANVDTTTERRRQEVAETGHVQIAYPHHPKVYQTVVWKDQALTVLPSGKLRLPCGGQRPPLLLPLAGECRQANLRRVELTWRADHYELCLTLDTGEPLPPPLHAGEIAGVDLGEVHIAAVTTTRRHALVVSGRQVRACQQWRHQVHSLPQEKVSRCQPGSRQAKRLNHSKAQVSARLSRQQRDILHKAARQVVAFCEQEGVSRIAVGDVRDIQMGVSLGKRTNQKISQWPHGQFTTYLTEKAARLEIVVEWIDEAYSTRTCSHSGHVQPSAPRGRRLRCSGCGARVHRDVNAAPTAARGRSMAATVRCKQLRSRISAPSEERLDKGHKSLGQPRTSRL
jgi:putative transposase